MSDALDDAGGVSDAQTFLFDGTAIPFVPGQTVGAALVASGISSWRATRIAGEPRGLFCGIGVCFDCLVTVDAERSQRACLVPAREGLSVRSTDPDEPLPGAADV